MKKICVVVVYFGLFPIYFSLWLDSCKYNSSIDFLIITDQSLDNHPKNVSVKNMTFTDFKFLAQSKFDFPISLERPYKICDYKPAYGIICNEYLLSYDFWGHCDFDMIFGNLREFLTEDLLDNFDKIYTLGHLSLYRNTDENNKRFMLSGSDVGDYYEVYAVDKSYAFDELGGIYKIYKKNNFKIYESRDFADISSIYSRFRLAKKDTNYNNQVFFFEDGNIYREYFDKGKHGRNKFAYLHIKKPKELEVHFDVNKVSKYYITNMGFYEKFGETSIANVKKYNKYKGALCEVCEAIIYHVKIIIVDVKNEIKGIMKLFQVKIR